MNPFIYPKVRHQRVYTPKQYKRYQPYKHLLRIEFERKCVYCAMPDTMKGYANFGVDHYRPKKPFTALATTYTNLFYCCNSCNSAKRDYWPAKAVERTEFVPNPCDHVMFDHLRFNKATVEHRSRAGEITKRLLDLNDPSVVQYREFMLASISLWEGKHVELEKLKATIQKKLKSGAVTAAQAATDIAVVNKELAEAATYLGMLAGA